MLDWFDYHGHMCIAFEMLGLSVFDFLVSLTRQCRCLIRISSLRLLLIDEIYRAERQQLSTLSIGPRQTHGIPDVLRREVSSRH